MNIFRVYDKQDHPIYEDKSISRMAFFGPEYFISDDGFVQFISPAGSSPIGDQDQERFSPLMRYVGINDKNNQMIFEGDFISMSTGNGAWIEEVKYEKHELFPWCGYIEHGEDVTNIEIIGNIWQNPELVGKTFI